MNVERLERLKAWLEDGAPHVVFSMEYAFEALDKQLDRDTDELSDDEVKALVNFRVQRDQKGIGDCGSICCIAGYTVYDDLKSKGLKDQDIQDATDSWFGIANRALDLLGLEFVEEKCGSRYDEFYKHPLFDPTLAPRNCSPQEAAKAVGNLLAGVDPYLIWRGVR